MTVQPSARPTPDPATRCTKVTPARWGERCQLAEGHTGRCALDPTPDTVTRRIHQHIDQPIRRSIMERYGLTRVPGSVWLDENGEVA